MGMRFEDFNYNYIPDEIDLLRHKLHEEYLKANIETMSQTPSAYYRGAHGLTQSQMEEFMKLVSKEDKLEEILDEDLFKIETLRKEE